MTVDESNRYRDLFNATLEETLGRAVRIIASNPALALSGAVILRHQKRAAAVRRKHEQEGLLVPPVMIVSVTSRCNLACAGCYMHGRGGGHRAEMEPDVLASVVGEAAALGVSIVVLAGGEPLVRMEEIFCLARAHPRVLFPVFTNGLLIDDTVAEMLAGCRNVVPVISFEGFRDETDRRRGSGVYDRLIAVCARLKGRNVFFGCSVTATRENFMDVTGEKFIRQMLQAGARAFAFVEYVPMVPGTEGLVLTPEQKKSLQVVLLDYDRTFPALFIGFPGDEAAYGGCLAAGRGFVHVSPSGDLEPCPAAPYSDANLAAVPLKDALRSGLLNRLRETPEVLTESSGGCALRANRAWVEALIRREKAPAGVPGEDAAVGGPEKGIVAVTAEHDDAMEG
ncbi:radical SAM protein [Methanoculleus sp.]|uniref:radical SAM protein n=1 Tax=Methanoculleus sp. TaxID=90427 RepID=UPI002FCBF63A